MALVFLGGGLVVFGGAAMMYAVAERRGRHGSLWAVASTAAAAFALWLSYQWLRGRIDDPSPDIGFLVLVPAFVAPTVVHGAFAAVALLIPPPTGNTRARSFEMRWLGAGGRDADNRCRLELGERGLSVASSSAAPAVEVAYADLVDSFADQECLRLRWSAPADPGEATLMLVSGPRTREGRVRAVRALAARITRARARL